MTDFGVRIAELLSLPSLARTLASRAPRPTGWDNAPLSFPFVKGAGTDDHTLIRVLVSRSEVDLLNIRKEFRKNFAASLYSMIKVPAPACPSARAAASRGRGGPAVRLGEPPTPCTPPAPGEPGSGCG